VALSKEHAVRGYYNALFRAWGRQHWWPASTPFEVIVGAYLTQNTAWVNVEHALRNLQAAKALNLRSIRTMRLARLEATIRPAGYFRQKAQRLKTFVTFLDQNYSGSLKRMFAQPTAKLREQLLALNGIGPETADSILLYAGQHSVFVVDAYTRRILDRHGILPANAPYEQIRELFERALAGGDDSEADPAEITGSRFPDVSRADPGNAGAAHPPSPMSSAQRSTLTQTYNEMHGLIVGVGKRYCLKSRPKCDGCPLQKFLPAMK
jgi:endonuclease III related protein